jgi:alanyl-tRNA synthetase
MDVKKIYESFCQTKQLGFEEIDNVRPYDDTTLFCPSGMQQFKKQFKDENFVGTFCNIQSCLRLNDLDEIGDGTHLLYFNMMGMFSFRQQSVEETIDLWVEFIQDWLRLKISYATIHPDKEEWWQYYRKHKLQILEDRECVWTDGEIGGYCTEFYIDDVEIGNIVNPLGTCIDVGFGLERLQMMIDGNQQKNDIETLKESIEKIIQSGYKPSNLKQGYVLRKLLRVLYKRGGTLEHPFFQEEVQRQQKIKERYERLKERYKDKSKEWWFDTHGIDLSEL